MADPHELGAAEAARAIRRGALSPLDLVTDLLKRIDAVEPIVRAWVHVDREAATRVARQRDAESGQQRFLGPLHGVPFALKDIFDAAGLPTTAGAASFAHRTPSEDASAVARLRAAGGVVLGKVTTTAFAFLDPSPTRNPWNPEHTPGGSSSGPAAAVAARMVPLALGSQTVGSVLRPAAYCGVVGFKPSHGRISVAGVVPLAWSFDHVGIFARNVEDCAIALGLMSGADHNDPPSSGSGIDEYAAAIAHPVAPRLGVLGTLIERSTPEMARHLREIASAFRSSGALVTDVELPGSYTGLHEAGNLIVRAEASAYHAPMFERHAAEYPPKIREAIEAGRSVRAVDYLAAQSRRRAFRDDMSAVAARYDALLLPVAADSAPRGLASTGDPYFCAPWSFAGMPTIALPSGLDSAGLPRSVQLVGACLAEARLLNAAAWCERVIGFSAAPRL
jgi:Asp-tRNA(Asn)/Glu-tRNA(Gln) amidotransferase A subunit family amidase